MDNDIRNNLLNGIHESAWTSKARSLSRLPRVDEAVLDDCAKRFNQPSELPAIIETLSNHEAIETDADALNMLAMAAFKLAEIEDRQGLDGSSHREKAKAWFAASVRVRDFNQARTLSNWAKLLLNEQHYEESEELLIRAKETDPKQAQPWVNYLELYTATNREEDRKNLLHEMHEKWPEHIHDLTLKERAENDPSIITTD